MQEDLGLSTEQLAEQAGLSPHLLARIENGTAKGDEWGYGKSADWQAVWVSRPTA
jgi:transcriptional regulator with XRE-family HTH domain